MQNSICDAEIQLLLANPVTRQDAAVEVYQKYTPALRSIALRRLPGCFVARVGEDDILQSTWRSFHGCVDTLRVTDSFWPYLFKILTRKITRVFEVHLAAKRDVRRESGLAVLSVASRAEPLNTHVEWLRESVDGLTGHYKQVMEMRLAGYSQAEIAEELGTSVRFVQRYQQSAIEMLRLLRAEQAAVEGLNG